MFCITSVKTVSIPPRSEVIVCLPDGSSLPATDSLVEPNYNETMKDHALTARTVVRPREIVPVRLMNVSEDSKLLHTGTLIRQLTKIGEVQKASALTEVLPSTELRSDLADLLKKTDSKLFNDQRQKAKISLSSTQVCLLRITLTLVESG